MHSIAMDVDKGDDGTGIIVLTRFTRKRLQKVRKVISFCTYNGLVWLGLPEKT